MFILRDQTTEDLKSHHLQARVTLTALSVPPFSRIVGNPLSSRYALPYILAISYNARFLLLF